MSMYGEDGSECEYKKEVLYDELERFLKSHSIDELLRVLADVVEVVD